MFITFLAEIEFRNFLEKNGKVWPIKSFCTFAL